MDQSDDDSQPHDVGGARKVGDDRPDEGMQTGTEADEPDQPNIPRDGLRTSQEVPPDQIGPDEIGPDGSNRTEKALDELS